MSKDAPHRRPRRRDSDSAPSSGGRGRSSMPARPAYLEDLYRFACAHREFQDVVDSLRTQPEARRGALIDRLAARSDEQGKADAQWIAAVEALRDPGTLADLVKAMNPPRFVPRKRTFGGPRGRGPRGPRR